MTADQLQSLAQSPTQYRDLSLLSRAELAQLQRLVRLANDCVAAGFGVTFARLVELDRLTTLTTDELLTVGESHGRRSRNSPARP